MFKKGYTPWNKGQKTKQETIDKLSRYQKGRTKSIEHRSRLAESKLLEKNPAWRGDSVSYRGLHQWLRENFTAPDKCEICLKGKKLDIANISGIYDRRRISYKFLCRSCHIKTDWKRTK